MGIDGPAARFLSFASAVGVDFTTTITLGHQGLHCRADVLRRSVADIRPVDDAALGSITAARGGFADGFFEWLGATSLDSIDVADFEGASVIHDMNTPLHHDRQYSCVVDGGATEHVFHVPNALENCMRLVAPGGHLLVMVPANDQLGHGFYQFGPELYFRLLCPDNGFEIRHVFLHTDGVRGRWLEHADPARTGHRITLSTRGETSLYVMARRIGRPGLHAVPQQSDYAEMWAGGSLGTPAAGGQSPESRRLAVARRLPAPLVRALQRVRRSLGTAGRGTSGVSRVDLAELARRP